MTALYFLDLAGTTPQELLRMFDAAAGDCPEMKSASRRALRLCGEALIRHVAAAALRVPRGDLRFARDERGKPYLLGHTDFFFNISHTAGAVAAVTGDAPVGVDIERQREANLKIAGRFFTERENLYIRAGDVNRRFFEVWTRKEAFLKRSGAGISAGLSSFDVLTGESAAQIHTFAQDGYTISCCCAGAPPKGIERIPMRLLV